MTIQNIQLATVPVTDQDRTADFFVDLLGFERVVDDVFGARRFVAVAPPDSGTGLILRHVRSGETLVPCFTGIVFGTDDVVATHKELVDKGVEFTSEPRLEEWGRTQALFLDPDGNTYVLHERQP